jgi:hypothetical protein
MKGIAMTMPPKKPEFKPINDLRTTEELIERLALIERDLRTDLLIRYLGDLKREFDSVAEELSTLGICARCYLHDWYQDDEDEGDDDNDAAAPAGVH